MQKKYPKLKSLAAHNKEKEQLETELLKLLHEGKKYNLEDIDKYVDAITEQKLKKIVEQEKLFLYVILFFWMNFFLLSVTPRRINLSCPYRTSRGCAKTSNLMKNRYLFVCSLPIVLNV